VLASGAIVAIAISFTRTHPATISDSGAYLSVERLLLRGYRLYEDIFDNKDPLFYYLNAAFLAALGPRGPAIAEALALGLAGVASGWFLVARGSAAAMAALAAACVPLALTPDRVESVLVPGLTHTWGMVATLGAVLALLRHRWTLGGVLVVVAALLEVRTSAIGLGTGALLLIVCPAPATAARRFTSGLVGAAICATAGLALRRELGGYLQLFRYNIDHFEDVLRLQSRDTGSIPWLLADGLERAFDVMPLHIELAAAISVAAGVSVARSARGRGQGVDAEARRSNWARINVDDDRAPAVAMLAVAVTSVAVTAGTYLFHHHLQLLGLPIAMGVVLVVDRFRRPQGRVVRAACAGSLVMALLLLGQPWTMARRIDGWRATLSSPAATALEQARPGEDVSYAIAGDVAYETAHAAFLDDRFRFSCTLIYQHPWDRHLFHNYIACLAERPDVILYTHYFEELQVVFPEYAELQAGVERVLKACFEPIAASTGSYYRLFERRRGCIASVD
jgi:hypothetical protein